MKATYAILLIILIALINCSERREPLRYATDNELQGTWKLMTGTLIENGDTTVTDYTKGVSFIKIINDTHFAFLHHDTGADSARTFSAGGGAYTLQDSLYTEHLEYCTAREWEGHDFSFVMAVHNDTLVQSGVEIVESAGVNRVNVEKYVRVRP
jgi:hypothetical protein